MAGPRLTETTVNLIIASLKANIAAALSDIRTDRGDALVSTEPPTEYFVYPNPIGYHLPIVMVVGEEFDFRVDQAKANFVCGKVRVSVEVIVEDQDRTFLTIKAWRYQCALREVLNGAELTTADNKTKCIVVVKRAVPSPHYKEEPTEDTQFRQAVLLECEVEHYEQF